MTNKKTDAWNVRSTNPLNNLSDNFAPDAFDYCSNPQDLQCFNCDDNLQGKEFAVGVCGVSSALGIAALIPLCLECCEFLESGEKELRTEAYQRLRNKTLSHLNGRNAND